MSREVSKGEEAAWAVLKFAWGTAQTVLVLVLVGLLVEHLKRKMDAGLVHWPGRPNATLWLGVPPWWPKPVQPTPPREGEIGSGKPAPKPTDGLKPPAPTAPGVVTVDLGGLLGVGQ